jgi:orotate phosphoribosyltransferase
MTAIEAARAAGMNILGVLCLVDREQGGAENIRKALGTDARFFAALTAADVRSAKVASA